MLKGWQHLRELSELPPRGSGTAGERRAAAWLRDRLATMGYEVETQPFSSPIHTLYVGPLLVIALVLVATWLSPSYPIVGALLGALSLVPLIGEMLGSKLNLDLLLPKHRSQNVVATLPEEAQPEEAIPVVIVAHYDTQWGSWLFSPRMRPYLRPFFILVYAALATSVVGLVLRWLLPAMAWVETLLLIDRILLFLTGLFLLVSLWTGRSVPGANDNGSGVAVALALAERWWNEAPNGVVPTFLFTGCEEVGLRGMRHYLNTAQLSPETVFINLDNVGGGRLRFLLGEGMLVYQRYDQELIQIAEKLVERFPGKVAPLKNLLLPTDGLLSAKAGFKTITFLGADEGNAIPNYHWHTDTIEKVDRNVLAVTERFVMEFLRTVGCKVTEKQAESAVADE